MMNNIFNSFEFNEMKNAGICTICTIIAAMIFTYFHFPLMPFTVGGLICVTGYYLITVRNFVEFIDCYVSYLEDESL